VHVFHRCVIAVLGVLAIGTSAAAGPIKLDAKAPSFDTAELRSMDQKELRALFFRGGGARNAAASCADCVAANSRLTALEREGKSAAYTAAFPFTAARLFKKPAANGSSKRPATRVPDLLAGPAATSDALAAVPLSSNEGASPLAVVSPAAVPEPNTLALIGTGVAGAWLVRRRRVSKQV
jgi:type IV secretory pathway VirB2 component (pilin)